MSPIYIVIIYVLLFYYIVVSEPDDVVVCEGRKAVLTCVSSRNSTIYSEPVQWYRYIKDKGMAELINPTGGNIAIHTHIGNTKNSSLTITNARKSYAGYYWVSITNERKSYTGCYWVGTPSDNVCIVSLIVKTSMHVLIYDAII